MLRGFGAIGVVRTLPETCRTRQKRQGLTEGEAHFEVYGSLASAEALVALLPPIGSGHPISPYAIMERRELVYIPAGIRAECWYAGVSDEDLDQPVYSLMMGCEEQPIETHDRFQSHIAGKPSLPLNGAIFVDTSGNLTTSDLLGVFTGFAALRRTGPSSFEKNPYAGIEAFLDASSIVYRERFVTRQLPREDVAQVGHIWNAPLPGPAPIFGGGRTWLYMGYNMEQRGGRWRAGSAITTQRVVYDITRDWRLSQRGGWNTTIYSAA